MSEDNRNTDFLKFELGQLRDHVDSRFTQVQSTLDHVVKTVDKMVDVVIKVSALEARLTHVENAVTNIETRVNAAEKQQVEANINLTRILTKFAVIGGAIYLVAPVILGFTLQYFFK